MTDKATSAALRLADALAHSTSPWAGERIVFAAAADELRRQHARIAELEAQIEAVGAGGVQALSVVPAHDNRVPEAWTNLLAYVLQDDMHNRLTPRVIDTAYTAFNLAKQPSTEDGGASDWFNDTRPKITELIEKLRKDLIKDRAASPTPPAEQPAQPGAVYAELPDPDLFADCDSDGGFLGDTSDVRVLNTRMYREQSLRDFADRTHALRQAAPKAAPQQEAQEPYPATFALWYADHIGDDNKPVREAAWETYQAFAGKAAPQAAPAQNPVGYVDERTIEWLANARSTHSNITTKIEKSRSFERPLAIYTAPQAAPAVYADPLQGAANWLVEAHAGLETSTLAGKLSIGYNRAKRLHDAALAAQGGA